MIELYRRMKRGSRKTIVKQVSIGAACFLVLAGIGVGLGFLQRDKGASNPAEVPNNAAAKAKDAALGNAAALTKRSPDATDEETDAEVAGATTTQGSHSTGTNVVQRSEDTELIAAHRDLFVTALSLLGDYAQHINDNQYTEAISLEPKVKAAIAKTMPGAIGADPQASYGPSIMIAVQEISTHLSNAQGLYAGALSDFQGQKETSGNTKFSDGQAKVQAAEKAYQSLTQ